MNETEIETLERLRHHYEALMQEWGIKNGIGGTNITYGVPLGYEAEVRALGAAVELLKEHGIPVAKVNISTNLTTPPSHS